MVDSSLISLDDPRALDQALVGAKAARLAKLRRAGFDVPPGFVIPVNASDFPLEEIVELGADTWAVRSSGPDEDGASTSNAGKYETFLNLSEESLQEGVERCRAQGSGGQLIPVIVQPMVHPRAAGVVFTADPASGDTSGLLIEASEGTADKLVSGEVEPERWQVTRETATRSSQKAGVLDADIARHIANIAQQVAGLFGSPQDVEWALTEGDLLILQARPITALSDISPIRPSLEPPGPGTWILDRGHFPEPVSPMGSEAGQWVEKAFTIAFREFGALVEGFRAVPIGWRVYSKIIPLGGREGRPPAWWVLAILSRTLPSFRKRARSARKAVANRLEREYIERWQTEWKPRMLERVTERRDIELSELSDHELVQEIAIRRELGREAALIHFRLFGPHVLAVYRFVTFCEDHLAWTAAETARRLVNLSPGSTSQISDLRPVIDLIRSKPEVLDLYSRRTPELVELRSDPDVAAALEKYLSVYGVRTPALDLIEPTLEETPYLLESLIQNLLQNGFPEPPSDAHLDDPGLEGPLRDEYHRLLIELKSAYAVRDENVLWTVDVPIGLLRLATLEMGRRLYRRGLLKDPEHVVFLYLSEAESALLHGIEPGEIIDQRRGERLWARAHEPAPYLGPPPQPPADMRGLPRELREINEALLWITQHDVAAPATSGELTGSGASVGIYRGPVRIIRNESDFASLQPGEVIVAPVANPAWSVLFPLSGALITDMGGILSHAAILAREFGVPAVMGVRGATTTLTDGQVVTVNGTTGAVRVDSVPGSA